MPHVERLGVVLEKSSREYENRAVLNPATYQEGEDVHMFYRAVSHDMVSSIGYCRLQNGIEVVERSDRPLIVPEHDYERKGVEDPRITKIDGTYYMVYVAYDGKNARLAYAVSQDLKQWEKRGVISPNLTYTECEKLLNASKLKSSYFFFSSFMRHSVGEDSLLWEKDGFLMPRKFDGKFALVHRILPEMQVVFFDDFAQLQDDDFWRNYLANLEKNVMIENTEWFEGRNIGGGCPALETYAGWLILYHGVRETNRNRTYSVGAALLDRDNPLQMVAKLKDPILEPAEEYEIAGDVRHTIFPTATAVYDNTLYLYYGAADERIAAAKIELDDFLRSLIENGREAAAR